MSDIYYNRTNWKDDETPINASNLNNIEAGISNVTDKLNSYLIELDGDRIKDSIANVQSSINNASANISSLHATDVSMAHSIEAISDQLISTIQSFNSLAELINEWSNGVAEILNAQTVKINQLLTLVDNILGQDVDDKRVYPQFTIHQNIEDQTVTLNFVEHSEITNDYINDISIPEVEVN